MKGNVAVNKSDGATVSVIVPTYQREEAIDRALRSVLGQRGIGRTTIEIVVVDDGSTDNTERAVKGIPVPAPHRIVYKKLDHIGQPGLVRNEGLAIASGDYIGYCDSDDIWLPHHLATCLRQFQLYPDSVMVETWWSFQTREKSLDRWKIEYQKASTDGRTTTTNSRLHRRDVLKRSGVFGDLRWGEDIDLWTRIGFVGPIRRIKIPTTAHSYTRFGDNLTFEFCPDIGAQFHGVPVQLQAVAPVAPPPSAEQELAAYRIIRPPLDIGVGRPLNMKAGASVSGVIPGEFVAAGEIARFGLQIGTHVGSSKGDLVIDLSVGDRSASGVASVDDAKDNATLLVPLKAPLAVSAGETVSYSITHPDGTDVAVWLSPTNNLALQALPYALSRGQGVRWTIEYTTDMPGETAATAPTERHGSLQRSSMNFRQVAKHVVKRVVPAPIKRSPAIRRAAFWAIDKVRPRS